MNTDEKLSELLKRINELAGDIERSRQELSRLYQEVKKISGTQGVADHPGSSSSTQHQGSRQQFSIENFVGLRLIHFIGIIALVMGLAIGVKYAIDKNLISPAMRIGLAFLAAAILFFISYRLRKNYRLFSLILFGGSMATAYFTTYGAFAYYQFLPVAIAFGLMLLLAVFTVYYSIRYNSQELAVLALVGGYGIPFLVRGNAENWIGLFSYIFIINLAVSYLSFRRLWTTLVYLSFTVTWLIFLSAIYFKFDKIGFTNAIVFSVLFFILFLVNTAAFRIVRKQQLQLPETILIITDIILIYFAFLKIFNFQTFEEISYTTLIFSLACLVASYLEKLLGQPMLQKALVLFGLFLLIIFIPMRFEDLTITIIWILMAALLFVIGLWKKFKLLRLISIILFAITLFKLIVIDSTKFSAIEKVISYILLGSILLAVSFLYQKFKAMIFEEDEG